MASSSAMFQQELGAQLAKASEDKYKFFKSRSELRADASDGHNVIVLSSATKYSPNISVDFYFGRNFASAKRVEKLLGSHQFYYHIQQYSPNRNAMQGLPYRGPFTWSVDITAPQKSLVSEIAAAVRGIADPFFKRFSTIETARDAMAANDPWCFGGKAFWPQLLLLDLAMDDLSHFEQWAEKLDSFCQAQAAEMIAKFQAATQNVV